MPDIKTRETVKDIKILDRSKVAGEKMKQVYIRSRNTVQDLLDDGQISPSEYAEDRVQNAAEKLVSDASHSVKKQAGKAAAKGREKRQERRLEKRLEKQEAKTNQAVKNYEQRQEKKKKHDSQTKPKTPGNEERRNPSRYPQREYISSEGKTRIDKPEPNKSEFLNRNPFASPSTLSNPEKSSLADNQHVVRNASGVWDFLDDNSLRQERSSKPIDKPSGSASIRRPAADHLSVRPKLTGDLQHNESDLREVPIRRGEIRESSDAVGSVSSRIKQKETKDAGSSTAVSKSRSIKKADKRVKTLSGTSKAMTHTANTVNAATHQKSRMTARKAQKNAEAFRRTSETAAKAAASVGKAIASAIKAIGASAKSLVAAITVGVSVAMVPILIVCMIGMLVGSAFGILFSGWTSGNSTQTIQQVVREINEEYQNKIETIKAEQPHDAVEMSGSRAVWPEVLSVYAVKTTTDPENAEEVATVTPKKKDLIRAVFWEMNEITWRTETKTSTRIIETDDGKGNIVKKEETVTKTTLYITVSHRTVEEMAALLLFSGSQREQLNELLATDRENWMSVLYGIVGSDDMIVQMAASQIGNAGGDPYWSWYGFSNHVDWCACFVSWCANECGYIENGIIPKYAGCITGAQWFKDRGQWADNTIEPMPGMIIFFDWDSPEGTSGPQDGEADHTGIVEKVEKGYVYTIEGNAGDAVKEKRYLIGYYEILGYGIPAY